MEKILDRFLRYVSVDTQSNEESESQPSTAKQLNLLKMLTEELKAMGVEATLDQYGYVMASKEKGAKVTINFAEGSNVKQFKLIVEGGAVYIDQIEVYY